MPTNSPLSVALTCERARRFTTVVFDLKMMGLFSSRTNIRRNQSARGGCPDFVRLFA
jgi:hypothetical protein